MKESEIEKLLKEKSKIIDEVIKKYIPKKYDKDSLESTLGKPTYRYNLEAPNKAIAEPVWEFLERGGKRWRPALFLLIIEALGRDPNKFVDLVIIPELVHNGTLMIDDIEDSSDMRRGKPCTYKLFGVDVAINVGNALYYLPLLPLIKNKPNLPKETLLKLYEIYSQEMINISFGQATDIAWHKGLAGADNLTEDEYLQMCAYKTGTLARMSGKMAAVLAGAEDKTIEIIGNLVESIAVAFQIQDDILNISGDLEKIKHGDLSDLGKEFGEDIKEGKRTLLVIHTLKNADEKDRKRLIEILNMHTSDINLIVEAVEIIKKYGSFEYAKKVARTIIKEAWDMSDKILPPSEAKEKLKSFANFLIEREI